MMKHKWIKIFMTIVFVIIFVNIFNIESSASFLSDAVDGAKDFLSKGDSSNLDESELQKTSSDIYNALLTISFVVVAVIGIVLGIQLMTSNNENKAEAKKSLLIFVVGCVITYGAFGIWRVMVSFLNTL